MTDANGTLPGSTHAAPQTTGAPQAPDPVDQKLSLEHEDVNIPGAGQSSSPKAPRATTPRASSPAKATQALKPTAAPAAAAAKAKTPPPTPASGLASKPAAQPEAATGANLSTPLGDPSVPVEEKKKAEESVAPAILEKVAKEVTGTEKPEAGASAAADAPKAASVTDSAAPPVAEPDSPAKGSPLGKKRKSAPTSPREGVRRSSRLK